MKFFLRVLLLILLMTSNSFSKSGKGELQLDKYTMEKFLLYLYGEHEKNIDGNKGGGTDNKNLNSYPMVFVVDESGYDYMYYYCPYASGCIMDGIEHKAKLICEKRSNLSPCWTFAKKARIMWKINKKSKRIDLKKNLKSGKLYVAKLIQEAGFYDGDIYELEPVINDSKSKTNKIITNNQSEKNLTNNTKSIADQIKDLKNLYDSGVLTKEEFAKAKKKILN